MQSCKYRLPCGWCDRKNEMCIYELNMQDVDELSNSKDLEIDHIIRTVKNGKLPKLNGKN